MQIANILLALGGDSGNQVPKYDVTASEIAVLRAIHGDESVTDVFPTGEIDRTHRAERERLTHIYRRPDSNGNDQGPVAVLFPGAAARLYDTLDELELPEEFFKALTRVSSKKAAAPVAEPEAAAPAKPKRGGKKAAEPAPEPEAETDEDPEDVMAAEDKIFG